MIAHERWLLAILAAAVAAAPAAAQTPAGGEIRVNSYTTGNQTFPAVAAARSGDFVVVWRDYGRVELPMIGQRFDRAGTPMGADFRVNTAFGALSPAVAVRPTDGGFLVVWSKIYSFLNTDIYARLFDASGRGVGADFRVSDMTLIGRQFEHAVAADGRGGFVVAWMRFDGGGYGIAARQVGASGSLGPEFLVNTYTTGIQIGTSVAADAAGNFVVVWSDFETGEPGSRVVAQRFDASGTRLGQTFLVNSVTTGGQFDGRVAMRSDGEFVVAFATGGGSGYDVVARRFGSSGQAIGAAFRVNTYAVNTSTTGNAITPAVAMDAHGNFVVSWRSNSPDGDGTGVAARSFRADGAPRGTELVVNTYTTGSQQPGSSGSVGVDEVGNFVITWGSPFPALDIHAQRFGGLHPHALELDTSGNGVWEPGETVDIRPAWFNTSGAAQGPSGTLSGLTGPTGATYSISDGDAVYPAIAHGAGAGCADCYVAAVTPKGPRPALHWDASALEALAPDALGQMKTWTLHLGGSFGDVPASSGYYRFVEALLHHGVAGGCGGGDYCPAASTSREQMAPFVLAAKEGAGYAPPSCGIPIFNDVPPGSIFCSWIEELARRGVTGGCGGGNYCPTAAVSREQMAVFVLRTLDPNLNPPACAPPNLFNDVPATSAFCPWIEELARRGVVAGCGGGNYCPMAPVTREQMAVFLTGTFGLTLYGP